LTSIQAKPYQLPSKVKAPVDRNYPGWRLLYPTRACKGDFNRAVLFGDFNGDGARDYVVKIESSFNGILLALLSNKGEYRQKVIIQDSARTIRDLGFSLGRRGTRLLNGQTRSVRLERDAVFVEYCDTGRNANYYVFRNGGFEPMR
jgi:hypothetical protein